MCPCCTSKPLLLAVVLQTMPPSQPDAPTGGQGPPRAVEALMTLDLLPAELWRAVAAYLSGADRTAFRAVSKARNSWSRHCHTLAPELGACHTRGGEATVVVVAVAGQRRLGGWHTSHQQFLSGPLHGMHGQSRRPN